MTVSVNGTNVSSSVGSDGSFTLSGVPAGPVDLRFSSNGSEARGSLSGVADEEQVTITVVINGATAQITVQKSEAEGTIGGLTTGCPVVTFTVGASRVSTDATTTFLGGICSQLANGARAEVTGTKQSDGSIKAVTVKIEDTPITTPPTTPAPSARELSGVVTGLGAGACPVTTFTVGTTKVTTDASTTFTGGTCLQLKNTITVEVKGTTQSDGSVKASLVNLEDVGDKDTEAESEIDGRISGLTSVAACPITTFTIGTTKVTTSGTTQFKDGTCPQLANTLSVQVKGVKQTDGSLNAARVDFEKD
jgi:hypothetical protein